jgi:hypothetical protein
VTLSELIKLLQNRIAALNGLKSTATAQGDVEQVVALETQIEQTQLTLDQLRSLS